MHGTQRLPEGIHPHHIFIHQYFITRGQRWVVAVSQIFSHYSPPIRTLASLRNPTPPYVPPKMGIGKMAHPCLFLACLWVSVMGGGVFFQYRPSYLPHTKPRRSTLLSIPPRIAHGPKQRGKGRGRGRDTNSAYHSHQRNFFTIAQLLHDKAEVRQDKDSGCSLVLQQIHLQRLSFRPQRE